MGLNCIYDIFEQLNSCDSSNIQSIIENPNVSGKNMESYFDNV